MSRQPYGLAADVWSLGCLLVTLITGKPPFESEAVKNTLDKVARADYQLPSYLSPEARNLIDHMLQKDPRHRPSLRRILTSEFFHPSKPVLHLRKLDFCERQLNDERPATPSRQHSRQHSRGSQNRNVASQASPPAAATSPGKEDLSPLSTKRLKHLRQITKHGTVEILRTGHVLLDFVGDPYLVLISGDGQRVRLLDRRDLDGKVTLDKVPALRRYTWDSLPAKIAKKYRYASRFVDLIRSKTPKVSFRIGGGYQGF